MSLCEKHTAREPYYLYRRPDECGELSVDQPVGQSPPAVYTFDPADPTPNIGGPLLSMGAGSYDNRPLEERPDVLTYTTQPLKEHLDVIGPIRLALFVTSSLPYSDFFGRVCDVHPDGRSMNICDGLLRLEPDNIMPQADGTLKIELEIISTAHRFLKDHRLRLQVSSGAHPRFARNLGTGEPLPTATRMVATQQTIYHDADHPSRLMLPVAIES
jgi:putative CocE/NonD family hydrolase